MRETWGLMGGETTIVRYVQSMALIPNFTGETGNFGVRSSRRGGRKLDEVD